MGLYYCAVSRRALRCFIDYSYSHGCALILSVNCYSVFYKKFQKGLDKFDNLCYNIGTIKGADSYPRKVNKMKKEQTCELKAFINNTLGKNYKMTFSSKSEMLHIRIGTYIDSAKDSEKLFIESKETERENIISKIQNVFPQYKVEKNNKRYQGFINDICITVS